MSQKMLGQTGIRGGDMTRGNIYKLMLRFALPLFISQTFQQLYNTADSLVVGHNLGTEALAAVSSSGPMIFLLTSFFDGMAMGSGVVISRYFGAGNKDKMSKAIHTAIAIGLASGLFLTVIGVAFTPTLLRWINTDPEVMPKAVDYFRYFFMGAIFLVMYNTLRGIMTAMGDSKRPLYYLIFSSMLNVLLDSLFIAVFKWGVWAAAVATVISQAASVVLCLINLLGKNSYVEIRIRDIRFHKEVFGEILKNGLPSGVQNSVIAFANIIVQSQINVFHKVATAAFGTYAKIEGFAFLPITSFSMAISTFISQNLGAGFHDRAKKAARFGIISSMCLAELIGILYFFLVRYLFGFFDTNPDVIALGVKQAHTECLFFCLLAMSHAIAAVCRGAGKAFVPMVVFLSVWCVFRVTYIFVVMKIFHDIGYIYMAYPITWSMSAIIFLIYYKKSNWVHGFDDSKEIIP